MSDQSRPWWSSGSGPDARVEPGPAARDRERPGNGSREPEAGDPAHGDDGRDGHEHVHGPSLADGDVCQVCPICTALRMVGEVRPDLVVHLAEAARHLTMAAKTIIDAQASGYRDRGLERIPLDDDES